MMHHYSITTTLLSLLISNVFVIVNGERIFDEIIFTNDTCNEYLNDNDHSSNGGFDVCAVLEFCTRGGGGGGDEGRTYGYRLVGGTTECTSPGPIMRLQNGIRHGIFLKNTVAEEKTNLHFHGLHLSEKTSSLGSAMTRSVQGGGGGNNNNLLIYDIDLKNNPHIGGGTYWYHSHLHGYAWDQVKGGAFGMIIISHNDDDDDDDDVGTTDPNVIDFLSSKDYEKIVIISDANTSNSSSSQSSSSGLYKANGVDEEKEILELNKDQWYRLRILIVGIDSHTSQIDVGIGDLDEEYKDDNCMVHALAHDGIYRFTVPKEISSNIYSLTTSSRLDVAIKCSNVGRTTFDITANGQVVGEIRIVDASSSSSKGKKKDGTPFEKNGTKSWTSKRLEYIQDLSSTKTTIQVQETMKLRIDETNINGVSQGSHKPLCDKNTKDDFPYGTIQEWKFTSGLNTHPFHLHVYPMQTLSEGCGPNHDVGEFYDSLLAPESSLSNPCIVRFYLIDYDGPATLHCHLFEHSAHGAITWLNVVNKNDYDERSDSRKRERRILHTDHTTPITCIGQCTEPTEPAPLCNDDNFVTAITSGVTTDDDNNNNSSDDGDGEGGDGDGGDGEGGDGEGGDGGGGGGGDESNDEAASIVGDAKEVVLDSTASSGGASEVIIIEEEDNTKTNMINLTIGLIALVLSIIIMITTFRNSHQLHSHIRATDELSATFQEDNNINNGII